MWHSGVCRVAVNSTYISDFFGSLYVSDAVAVTTTWSNAPVSWQRVQDNSLPLSGETKQNLSIVSVSMTDVNTAELRWLADSNILSIS